jgi:hypothetical protein
VFECEVPTAGGREGEAVDPPGLVAPAELLKPGSGEPFDTLEFLAVHRSKWPAVPA